MRNKYTRALYFVVGGEQLPLPSFTNILFLIVLIVSRFSNCIRGLCNESVITKCLECYVVGQELVASSVTLSSSSAASSLLLDSAAGEEKLGCSRWRANRASSVYTGSSEDISLHSDQVRFACVTHYDEEKSQIKLFDG